MHFIEKQEIIRKMLEVRVFLRSFVKDGIEFAVNKVIRINLMTGETFEYAEMTYKTVKAEVKTEQ